MTGYPPSRKGCADCRHHQSMHSTVQDRDGLGRMPPGRCTVPGCPCPAFQSPRATLDRLLALEAPEDARRISAEVEPGWEGDPAGAFNRAARKVLG